MAASIKQSDSVDNDIWTGLVSAGIAQAINGLGSMVGRDVLATFLSPHSLAVSELHQLAGGPEDYLVAIHLGVTGDAPGHMLLLFQPQTAFELIDLLLGEEQGTTQELGSMEISVVGEMGNIMGARFLSSLGDVTGAELRPSPPTVMMDMAAAVLDAVVADMLLVADELLIVETRFGTANQQIRGTFLVLPNPELRRVLTERWSEL